MTRIYRFEHKGKTRYGIETRNDGKEATLAILPGTPFESLKPGRTSVKLSNVQLLAPCQPTKIVAIGLNYRDHAAERGKEMPAQPRLFLKPPSAVIAPGDAIVYPKMSKRVDYEGELGVVIARRASHVRDDEPVDPYILGYTCVNDVTARDLQDVDIQYTRAKGFDTFAPIGPAIVTGLDSRNLSIETRLNGKTRQSSSTKHLIFQVEYLIRFISQVMTLEPGDVISTGTPSGIGPMTPGDHVEVEIEGIGTLSNTVMKVREDRA